jgi:hypothetical protein
VEAQETADPGDRTTPVVPAASIPAACWAAARSRPGSPSVPATRSGQTASWAPGTETVATGEPARTAAITSSSATRADDGWISSSTVPPQVRPTSKASPSLTPYVCCRALRVSTTSSAAA